MYACSVCNTTVGSLKTYVRHLRLHRNVSCLRFKCGVENCPKTFATYAAFSTHVSRYHNSLKQENACQDLNVSLRCSLGFCEQQFRGPKQLLYHLKVHLADQNTVLCPFSNCARAFSKKSSFTSHLSRHHPQLTVACLDDRYKTVLENAAGCSAQKCTSACDGASEMQLNDVESANDDDFDFGEASASAFNENFKRSLALFYLKLQTKHLIPASTIQLIVDEFTAVSTTNQEYLLGKTKMQLESLNLSSDCVSSILQEMKNSDLLSHCNSFDFRNDYLRKKFYKKNLHYVEPTSVFLGLDDNRKERYGQYIPIKLTIQSLFKHCSVQNQYLNPLSTRPGVLSDVSDGSVFCSNSLFREAPNALKIILYQDAFEVVNPLGAAKKRHKLLAVYMTLANIYPCYRSTVDQMQLVLLCREADLKFFGWEKILCPLVQDLQDIESSGCSLFDDVTVRGSMVCLIGDNLGSHGVGGFQESFSAAYFCRYCLITQKEFSACPFMVGETRTVASYKQDISEMTSSTGHSHGVKADSVFNKLKYYHVCAPGLPPCIGHDLFEGVVKYDLCLFISHMVNVLRWFSFETINRRLKQFQFLGDDASSRPCPVNPRSDSLDGNAVQNWCMLRMLSLLVGDKVEDPENETWQLYLQLKKIVELVCCKSVMNDQIVCMHVLVEDYLDRRHAAFPDVNLRPKHHYLIHYANLTLKFGPLMHLWTMRFESKHSYFKRCIRYSQNFKNVCASLAERHQLLQAYFSDGDLFPAEIQVENGVPFCTNLYNDTVVLAVNKYGFSESDTVACTQAVVQGCKYQKDAYIAYNDATGLDSCFGKIVLIFVNMGTDVYFLVDKLVSEYVPSKHVYYVRHSEPVSYSCVSINGLCHVGVVFGYEFCDGVLLSMKSALPTHCV